MTRKALGNTNAWRGEKDKQGKGTDKKGGEQGSDDTADAELRRDSYETLLELLLLASDPWLRPGLRYIHINQCGCRTVSYTTGLTLHRLPGLVLRRSKTSTDHRHECQPSGGTLVLRLVKTGIKTFTEHRRAWMPTVWRNSNLPVIAVGKNSQDTVNGTSITSRNR